MNIMRSTEKVCLLYKYFMLGNQKLGHISGYYSGDEGGLFFIRSTEQPTVEKKSVL